MIQTGVLLRTKPAESLENRSRDIPSDQNRAMNLKGYDDGRYIKTLIPVLRF